MTSESSYNHTPLIQQYYRIKEQVPDALLLFQVGDFYEFFFDDAKKAASILHITLTKRGKTAHGEPIPLCGIPLHTVDHYVPKLVRAGYKVALCDQLEPAQQGKTVERGITRVLTPGTFTEINHLDPHKASYILSLFPHANSWGLLFGELLTAQLHGTILLNPDEKKLETELGRFLPDEIIIPSSKQAIDLKNYFARHGYFTSIIDEKKLHTDDAERSQWLEQYNTREQAFTGALACFHDYIRQTHQAALAQCNSVQWYEPDDFLLLDGATQKNLELLVNTIDSNNDHTLFSVLNRTKTPMGARTIKKWIQRPLAHYDAIMQRHDFIESLCSDPAFLHSLSTHLICFGDLERVVGRIALHTAKIADYIQIRSALQQIPTLIALLQEKQDGALCSRIVESIHPCAALKNLLEQSLADDPSAPCSIKKGYSKELDTLRDLAQQGTQRIIALEREEQELTKIPSLKIGHSAIHGYYFEVTKTHYHAVPHRYVRRQTLVGRERFTTQQLQELEYTINQAGADSQKLEAELLHEVKRHVAYVLRQLRTTAQAIAQLDALVGLATAAYQSHYVRPRLTATRDILIEKGRHPIVEQVVENRFVPNDTVLTDDASLWIITGPNMGGKSTYLRQVALMSIMAQVGSFVPATKAQLPILDRIFTRIGAGDSLATGKSTFMVEMEEAATICRHATDKSLVILDEVGRGTSTIDGLAIAQAIVEYLLTTIKARTLFATHYHELTTLAANNRGIANYYTASVSQRSSKAENNSAPTIVFLHSIVPGIAQGSFGIEVARLAALPESVIARATELVQALSADQNVQYLPSTIDSQATAKIQELEAQLALYKSLQKTIRSIDYDDLSPKKAFDFLWALKERE